MNKKIINAILILIGIAAVYCTYQFYYTKNQEVIDTIKGQCDTVQVRINELEALIAQEDTYRGTIKSVLDDISKKAKEFANTNDVPAEDVIMYAVNMEKEYVGKADTKTEREEEKDDSRVAPQKITLADREKAKKEKEDSKDKDQNKDKDDSDVFNPYKDSALFIKEINFSETASIANFSANFSDCQMNFNLYQTSPTYSFSTNYGGMEYIIDMMVSDKGTKRVLDFIDMKYNRSNGELTGIVQYSIYTMDHENSSKYDHLEIDDVIEGPENIYGGRLKEREEETEEEKQLP